LRVGACDSHSGRAQFAASRPAGNKFDRPA
jgi:hypothetical protein